MEPGDIFLRLTARMGMRRVEIDEGPAASGCFVLGVLFDPLGFRLEERAGILEKYPSSGKVAFKGAIGKH